MKASLRFRLIAGAFLVIMIAAVIRLGILYEILTYEHVISWVNHARSHPVHVVVFYILFCLGVLGLPITMFPVIGGVLFPYWIALPLNVMAATMGAWLAFLISRVFGREAVEPLLKGRLRNIDRIASHHGFKTVALIRFIGIPPFLVANYALGLSAIRSRDFFVGTIAGILPWMMLVTFASSSLWQAVLMAGREGFGKALFKAVAPLMALSLSVFIGLLTTFVLKWRGKRKKGIEETIPTDQL